MKRCVKVLSAGLAVALLQISRVCANIDAPKVDKTKKAPAAAPLTDKQILMHLYWENMWETEADKVAEEKGASDRTQGIADAMIKDHIFFAKEIRALAGRLGVKLNKVPEPMSVEGQRIDKLSGQLEGLKNHEGADFDRLYKTIMLKRHDETIHFIERQRALLPKDSPVYSLLGNLLPKVRDHYEVIASTEDDAEASD